MTLASLALHDLRFADLRSMLAVCRQGSVGAAARELGTTPSQVSKAVARLERLLGAQLFVRSPRGLTLSDHGTRLAPLLENVERSVEDLEPRALPAVELTVAADAYLIAMLLPAIARSTPGLRVRGLEMPAPIVRAQAPANLFHMALLTEEGVRLPSTWSQDAVESIRFGLFGAPKTAAALGPSPVAAARLRGAVFVTPIFSLGERFVPVDDGCPLPRRERRVGHQTQSMHVALELAAQSDQLVFGPASVARRFVDAGLLCEIDVEGWALHAPLYLACDRDRVLDRVRERVIDAVRRELAAE